MSLSFIGATLRRSTVPLNTIRFLVPHNAKLHASAPSMGLEKFFDNDRGWNWDPNRPRQKYWDCATLRTKSFEDLQVIHYKTLIELNKLYSMKQEAKRFSLFFPHRARINQVKQNIKFIKIVVWERKIAYERAKAVHEAVLAENAKDAGENVDEEAQSIVNTNLQLVGKSRRNLIAMKLKRDRDIRAGGCRGRLARKTKLFRLV